MDNNDLVSRDGLQNESKDKIIPATVKVELIEKLKQAGLKKIECGSFVHPKWVPQMANSGEVFDILNSKNNDSDVTYIGLVMNQRGIERAFEKNVREVVYVLSASEEFAIKNMNCTICESYNRMSSIIEYCLQNDIIFRVVISTALGCPYEGYISPIRVAELINKMSIDYSSKEIDNIIIADTIGIASVGSIYKLLDYILYKNDFGFEIGVHFHDTYGQALSNILISLSMNINIIESSIGGLGGCPFAKGATGNVATEDIVYMLNDMNIETNIDLQKLIHTSNFINKHLNKNINASSVTNAINARKQTD